MLRKFALPALLLVAVFVLQSFVSMPKVVQAIEQRAAVILEVGEEIDVVCLDGRLRTKQIGTGFVHLRCVDKGGEETPTATRETPTPTEETPTPTPTDPTPTPTEETPTPTPTEETPTPTPTEPGGEIAPYPDAPDCEVHVQFGPGSWHRLWNPDVGCWYDHGHGADVSELFPGMPNVDQIGGPWNTPGENDFKHRGFTNWCAENLPGNINDLCVQIHSLSSNPAIKARFHSVAFWVRFDNGGTLHSGGEIDFGILHVPYKTDFQLTAYDPASFGTPGCTFDDLKGHPPYRSGNSVDNEADIRLRQRNLQQWNSQIQPVVAGCFENPSHQIIVSYDFFTHDAWDLVDSNNPCWLDPAADCYPNETPLDPLVFNGSLHRVYNFVVNVPMSNGFMFVDRLGFPAPGCTEEGFNCIPYYANNAPAGSHGFDLGAGFPTFDPANPDNRWHDNDYCFIGDTLAPCYQDGAVSVGKITYPVDLP